MSIDQNNVSKLLSALSNPLRRKILFLIFENSQVSFTEILTTLEIDTGKLSFHLRNLKVFLEQTPTGKYKLNKLGQNAIRLVRDSEALSVEVDFFKNKTSLHIATLKRRALAFLIDLAVIFTMTIAITLLSDLSSLMSGQYYIDFNILLFLSLLWLYSSLLEGFEGQTLGKVLLGLKVESVGGRKLSYDTAAVRNLGKCFLLPIDLIGGLRLKDQRFLKYFDKFSGTTVIQFRHKKSSSKTERRE